MEVFILDRARLAPWYRLTPADVSGARLRDVHDTGAGGIIVTLSQQIHGIEAKEECAQGASNP